MILEDNNIAGLFNCQFRRRSVKRW